MLPSRWPSILQSLLVCTVILGAFAWVGADDWAQELEQEQRAQALAQERAQWANQNQLAHPEPEFEPDWNTVKPDTPIQAATRHVKKTAVKAKKRIKQTLK